jgi:hypothetical protein
MKNKIVITLILIISLLSCESKKELNNDLKELNIHGEVKQIKNQYYDAKESFGEIEKGEFGGVLIKIFNDDGNQIEEKNYNPDGSVNHKIIFKYDNKGLKTEKRPYNKDGNPFNYYKYSYNTFNQIISEIWFDYSNNEIVQKITFEYDEKGNLVTQTVYSPDNISAISKYNYDDLGRKFEYNYYDRNGLLKWIRKYNYDDSNRLLENISIDSYSKEMTRKTGYKYDAFGNVNEESKYNSDSSLKEELSLNIFTTRIITGQKKLLTRMKLLNLSLKEKLFIFKNIA